ncbi:hypothetical protein [Actinacidiphila rubida]|uniref:hypothetical protein n=1 Tax=Actinacidiphila rubida TaxID=310780 RepID=UPI000849B82F|nr:hypothetical protein [Actinacidiphila rubida]
MSNLPVGSVHVPHPDPRQMGLSIGEGQDGAPARWGRWDGQSLTVYRFEDEDLALTGLSPSGDLLLSVTHDQDRLAVHRTRDGSVLAEAFAESSVPRHPKAEADNDEVYAAWDWAGGFLDETTVIAGTVESDEEWGEGRHWLIDVSLERAPVQVEYPFTVTSPPFAIGEGSWYTFADAGRTLHAWTLD